MTKKSEAKKDSQAREEEYKGKPVLGLYRNADDKYPLKFGLAKAGLILAHVEEIKAFRAKHSGKEASATA